MGRGILTQDVGKDGGSWVGEELLVLGFVLKLCAWVFRHMASVRIDIVVSLDVSSLGTAIRGSSHSRYYLICDNHQILGDRLEVR